MKYRYYVRYDDVYLGGIDDHGDPWFVPRDEAVRFKTKALAKEGMTSFDITSIDETHLKVVRVRLKKRKK